MIVILTRDDLRMGLFDTPFGEINLGKFSLSTMGSTTVAKVVMFVDKEKTKCLKNDSGETKITLDEIIKQEVHKYDKVEENA